MTEQWKPDPRMQAYDELSHTLKALGAIEDLLCELPDMHVVGPDELACLLNILRTKAQGEAERMLRAPLRVAA